MHNFSVSRYLQKEVLHPYFPEQELGWEQHPKYCDITVLMMLNQNCTIAEEGHEMAQMKADVCSRN